MNINTKEYWENKFSKGIWEKKSGRLQTTLFAMEIVKFLNLPPHFNGVILDFGCGLGDAFTVYRDKFKFAKLVGVDITESAIAQCRQRYNHIAEFLQCDYTQIPNSDVIICCAVFEHLSDQMEITKALLKKCHSLFIIVPYKEDLRHGSEHVNSYNKDSFNTFDKVDRTVFVSKGWSEFGLRLWINVYLKNLMRPLFGKKILRRKKMIIFHLKGTITK